MVCALRAVKNDLLDVGKIFIVALKVLVGFKPFTATPVKAFVRLR